MLALHGIDTYGLEVSPNAVDVAQKNIQSQLSNPSTNNFGTNSADRPQPGKAQVILGDFFQRSWETQFGPDFRGFDIIYDYTVCIYLFPTTTYTSLHIPVPMCITTGDA